MALVLCQQCLFWVEPIAEQCPQCDYPIDLRAADPTIEELAAAIGPLIAALGPVRLSRATLPDRGQLYATGGGLFFVPQLAEQIRRGPRRGFVFLQVAPRLGLKNLARFGRRRLTLSDEIYLRDGRSCIFAWQGADRGCGARRAA